MEPLRQPPAARARRREAHLAAAHKVRPEEGHAFAHEALDRGIGLRIRARARVRDERVLELGQPRAWGLPPFPVLSARPIVVDQRGGGPRDSGGERPVKSLLDGAAPGRYPVCHARHKLVGCRNGSGHGPRLHTVGVKDFVPVIQRPAGLRARGSEVELHQTTLRWVDPSAQPFRVGPREVLEDLLRAPTAPARSARLIEEVDDGGRPAGNVPAVQAERLSLAPVAGQAVAKVLAGPLAPRVRPGSIVHFSWCTRYLGREDHLRLWPSSLGHWHGRLWVGVHESAPRCGGKAPPACAEVR
eukprot:scaffold78500_cov69-Phaeocystis_antarctica.AAC.2